MVFVRPALLTGISTVWLKNQLQSAGLELVLSNNERSCIIFFTNNKTKMITSILFFLDTLGFCV